MENNNLSNELILNNNASLREYYTQLLSMYNKSVKLLNALNESLTSNAAEIEVNVSDTDNASSVVRIPSFLYLENKLEELSSTISSFFNIPKDGEAWFTDNGLSYKLNLVRSNIAPIKPTINNTNNFIASLTDNNILKDLVLPKTFVKIPINGLPANISQLFVKKIVIPNSSTFLGLLDASYRDLNSKYSTISYDECKARLYNLVENVDYVEYDTVINLPLKKDYYTSAFKIENIIERWTSDNKINYKVQIDTLHYFNTEDSSIRYELKPGDIICLGNEMVTFTVKSILDNKIIHIEENVGYASLQPYSENSQMVFQIYVSDYSKFNYVQVPLEEDQYIIVFISTIWKQNGYFIRRTGRIDTQ